MTLQGTVLTYHLKARPVKPVARGSVIVVVHDDRQTRLVLESFLGSRGFKVKTYSSGQDLLDAYESGDADCLIYYLDMVDLDGLTMLERLGSEREILPIIMLTDDVEVSRAIEVMRAGALDLVQHPFEPILLDESLKRALSFRRKCQKLESVTQIARTLLARLTAREWEVLNCLIAGCSNKVVASQLGISPRTVEVHRARVIEKLEAGSLVDLVRIALAAGIEPPGFDLPPHAGNVRQEVGISK